MENRFQQSFKAQQKAEKQEQKKARLLFGGLFLLLALVFVRSFYLQVFQAENYGRLVEAKNQQLKSIPVQKGSILTSDGQILAASVPRYSVYLDPYETKNHEAEVRQALVQVLKLDPKSIPLPSNKRFFWLKRYISLEEKAKLEDLSLPGVTIVRDFQRIYPALNHLSNILGFTGKDSNGLEGLEFKFDRYLRESTTFPSVFDWFYKTNLATTVGSSLVLTVDDRIQTILQKSVRDFALGTNSLQALSLVLESKTGAILGAASFPDYNPNFYGQYSAATRSNAFIGNIYEPGSTFKIITLSIALEGGYIRPTDQFDCELGKSNFFGQPINDTSPLGHADLNTIIEKSSNICAAKIGLKIPKEYFYDEIQKFGFLQKTGVELSGESEGQLRSFDKWKPLDQAILSYGHGIGVTTLQMLAAMNVLANKGVYIHPSIVEYLEDSNGEKKFFPERDSYRVISKKVAETITGYMRSVVSPEGTGRLAAFEGVAVAGKTGTTKKFDPVLKKYSSEDLISSFVAFFPADNPKYTILTLLNNPRKSYRGSTSASLLFHDIAGKIWQLDYKNRLLAEKKPSFFDFSPSNRLPAAPAKVARGTSEKEQVKQQVLRSLQ